MKCPVCDKTIRTKNNLIEPHGQLCYGSYMPVWMGKPERRAFYQICSGAISSNLPLIHALELPGFFSGGIR